MKENEHLNAENEHLNAENEHLPKTPGSRTENNEREWLMIYLSEENIQNIFCVQIKVIS